LAAPSGANSGFSKRGSPAGHEVGKRTIVGRAILDHYVFARCRPCCFQNDKGGGRPHAFGDISALFSPAGHTKESCHARTKGAGGDTEGENKNKKKKKKNKKKKKKQKK